MISAQNRLLQLNGSKILIALLLSTFIFSCSSSKSAVDPNTPRVLAPNDEIKEVMDSELSVDTVQWTIISEEVFPPITSEMEEEVLPFEMERQDYYDIALLLPFRISSLEFAPLDANNEKFAQFYAGFKMAIEKIDNQDVSIRIRTYQTNRDVNHLNRVVSSLDGDKPDVIIGPFERKNLAIMAEYARDNRIPVISPWTQSSSVTTDNLFYLQLRPNISAYYSAILKHMTFHFDRNNIRVISNADGKDKSMISFIQNLNLEKSELPLVQPLEEYSISEDSLLYGDSLVFETAFEEGANVFFIPHYNTARHQDFVYQCLRKINAEKAGREIYVYAMPIALNSDRVDLNILKNINLRVCDYRFLDPRSPFITNFKKVYVKQFGWMPSEDAFYGYDVAKFIDYGLKEYGKYFHYYMKEHKFVLNQMSINIIPYYDKDENFKYLMNDHLEIIQFEDDYFVDKNVD